MAIVERERRASARPSPKKRAGYPSRQTGYAPVYASRVINHPSWETVVPTRQLAPVLEEIVAQADADAIGSGECAGGLKVVCQQAARHTGMSLEALQRRAYEIRNVKGRATRATTAEAFLLAGNLYLHDTDIIQLPAGLPAARERIEVYLELRGQEMSEHDIEELAEDLLEFAKCVIHGPGEEQVKEAADVVAELEGEVTAMVGEQLTLESAA